MAESLAGTVKVPGLGNVPKKEAAIGAVVVVTLIIVYYVRQRSSSASSATTAAAAATSTDQYPPDGTVGNPQDPYSTDPATQQTYGDEAAGSGLFGAYGSGGAFGNSGSGYDPFTGMYTDPNGNVCSTPDADGYCPNTSSSGGTQGPPFSSNSDWSNWVIQQEQTLNPGADIGALQDALGLFLNGQPVDTSQQQLIFDAIAIGGEPPVAGANGYPPSVKLNGNKGGQGTVTVPNVTGQRADTARQALRQAGLTYNISDTATGSVTAQSPKEGANVNSGSTVKLTLSSGTGSKPPVAAGVAVPNVTGQRAENARPALRQAGLTYNISDKATGTVTAQSPKAGVKVASGSRVSLTLKK